MGSRKRPLLAKPDKPMMLPRAFIERVARAEANRRKLEQQTGGKVVLKPGEFTKKQLDEFARANDPTWRVGGEPRNRKFLEWLRFWREGSRKKNR